MENCKYFVFCLSNCILKTFATSHQAKVSSILYDTFTPNFSIYFGIKVGGPQSVTSAPNFFKQKIFDNAILRKEIGNGNSILVTQKYNQLIVSQAQYIGAVWIHQYTARSNSETETNPSRSSL